MANTKPPNFGLIVVPRSCDDQNLWDQLIEKSKVFRLNALKESPEAFASTYEREVAFAHQVWAERLSNPQAALLVTVQDLVDFDFSDEIYKVQALVHKEWLATTVMLEPADGALNNLTASQSPWNHISDPHEPPHQLLPIETISFVLNGVYVAPRYRNMGAGSTTLNYVFEVGQTIAKARERKIIQYQVLVDAANFAALKLYEKAGFSEVRRERLQVGEKMKDGTILPQHEAIIIVMERIDSLAA